jgi:hypothetical protein
LCRTGRQLIVYVEERKKNVKDCKRVVQEGRINNREKELKMRRRKAKQEIPSDAAKA